MKCLNCGADMSKADIRCPSCGTLHVDLSAFDWERDEKIACTFSTPARDTTLTVLAQPSMGFEEYVNPWRCAAPDRYTIVIKLECYNDLESSK